jgi:hypothetical protein
VVRPDAGRGLGSHGGPGRPGARGAATPRSAGPAGTRRATRLPGRRSPASGHGPARRPAAAAPRSVPRAARLGLGKGNRSASGRPRRDPSAAAPRAGSRPVPWAPWGRVGPFPRGLLAAFAAAGAAACPATGGWLRSVGLHATVGRAAPQLKRDALARALPPEPAPPFLVRLRHLFAPPPRLASCLHID